MPYDIARLTPSDLAAFRGMNALYAAAFEDADSYLGAPPDDDYVRDLLAKPDVIELVAKDGERVIGALSAYVLRKHERVRAECYIYDLAVDAGYRRRGVATALIDALKPYARAAGAWVIYVQADPPDAPAVALYDKLGVREEVFHFDIPVAP